MTEALAWMLPLKEIPQILSRHFNRIIVLSEGEVFEVLSDTLFFPDIFIVDAGAITG